MLSFHLRTTKQIKRGPRLKVEATAFSKARRILVGSAEGSSVLKGFSVI